MQPLWPGGGETIFCNKFLRTGPSLSFGLDYYVCLKRNSSYSIGHMHSSGEILGNNFPTHSKDCILLLLNSLKQIYVYEIQLRHYYGDSQPHVICELISFVIFSD